MQREIDIEKSAIQVTSAAGQQRKRVKKVGDASRDNISEGELKSKPPNLGVGETAIEAQNLSSYFDMMQVNKDPQSTAKFEQPGSHLLGNTPNSNFG